MIKIPSHIDYYVVFARKSLNQTAILDKNSSNHYYEDNNDKKTRFLSIDIHQSCDWSNIPRYSNTNFNSFLHCMQPGLSTCGFDRLIWVLLWDNCSISSLPMHNSLFYGKTMIMNSS